MTRRCIHVTTAWLEENRHRDLRDLAAELGITEHSMRDKFSRRGVSMVDAHFLAITQPAAVKPPRLGCTKCGHRLDCADNMQRGGLPLCEAVISTEVPGAGFVCP